MHLLAKSRPEGR